MTMSRALKEDTDLLEHLPDRRISPYPNDVSTTGFVEATSTTIFRLAKSAAGRRESIDLTVTNSSSSALASLRARVTNPSVNQP